LSKLIIVWHTLRIRVLAYIHTNIHTYTHTHTHTRTHTHTHTHTHIYTAVEKSDFLEKIALPLHYGFDFLIFCILCLFGESVGGIVFDRMYVYVFACV